VPVPQFLSRGNADAGTSKNKPNFHNPKHAMAQNQSLACSFGDYRAATRRVEEVVGNSQDLVDLLVLWLRSCRLSDADLLAVADWRHHSNDLVRGELFSQRGPGGMDALIQESLFHRSEQMTSRHAKEAVGLDPVHQVVKDGSLHQRALHRSKGRLDPRRQKALTVWSNR
jgi:hypothetical protein